MDELELQKIILVWCVLLIHHAIKLSQLPLRKSVVPVAAVAAPPALRTPRRVSFGENTITVITPLAARRDSALSEEIKLISEEDAAYPGYRKLICDSALTAGILVKRYQHMLSFYHDVEHVLVYRPLCSFFSIRKEYDEALPFPSSNHLFTQILLSYDGDLKVIVSTAEFPRLFILQCESVERMDVVLARLKRSIIHTIQTNADRCHEELWRNFKNQLGLVSWQDCVVNPVLLNPLFKRDGALIVTSEFVVKEVLGVDISAVKPGDFFSWEVTSKWDSFLSLNPEIATVAAPSGVGAGAGAGAGSSTDPVVVAPTVDSATLSESGAYCFRAPLPVLYCSREFSP